MTILSYSRLRLQIAAIVFSLSAFGLFARWWLSANVRNPFGDHPLEGFQLEWIYPLTALVSIAMVVRTMVLLGGDLAALRALPEGLEVTGFLRRRVLLWDTVLGGHKVNYGNLLHRNRWFNVRYLVDGSMRAARVPLILTKRPSGGQMSLPEKIEKARDEAMGRKYAPSGERIEGTGFDPDAAIKRYLQAKAEGGVQAPAGTAAPAPAAEEEPASTVRPPVRPAFGRKGLG